MSDMPRHAPLVSAENMGLRQARWAVRMERPTLFIGFEIKSDEDLQA
jgi:hypothetical protein